MSIDAPNETAPGSNPPPKKKNRSAQKLPVRWRLRRWLRQRSAANRKLRQLRDSELCLVSYPQSGRTWLRVILGKIIHEHFGLQPSELIFLTCEQARLAGLPRLYVTHGYPTPVRPETAKLEAGFELLRQRYQGKRAIILVRDIRDLLVSRYHKLRKRGRVPPQSIQQFLEGDFGVRHIALYHAHWQRMREELEELHVVRYEQLHREPLQAIQEVLSFFGVPQTDPALVQRGIDFASFDNMQNMERACAYPAHELRSASGQKVRKGKIGSYSQELTPQDLALIERTVEETGAPREWMYWQD